MQIEITENMLRLMSACGSAIRLVAPFLPAQISTEPEANLELVVKIHDHYKTTPSCTVDSCTECHRILRHDLGWLMSRCMVEYHTEESQLQYKYMPTYDELYSALYRDDVEDKLLAQALAFSAQLISTAVKPV